MWWRLTHREFEACKGQRNREGLRSLVEAGDIPGLIAYFDGEPIGWCAVAPRDSYPRIGRSRILQPIDEQPAWSIVCLFVTKAYRRRGVSAKLIRAAVEYAVGQGARIVEGYPVEPKSDAVPDVFAFHGLASSFVSAGFREMTRRSETRPIMRWYAADRGVPPRLKIVD
jgi:GNAT superfamily N-acetyltransferase